MGRYNKKEASYKRMALSGIESSSLSAEELVSIFRTILEQKIHGICFSPYTEGQGPGTQIGASQIRERLKFIQPYVNWVRTFSCTEGNDRNPQVCLGIRVRMPGAGLLCS